MKTHRRSHRRWRLVEARSGLVMLAGLLLALGARAAAAQDTTAMQAQDTSAMQAQDTTPMTLVVAVFRGPTAAQQAMSHMQTAQKGHLESYAVVSKDRSGNVTVQGRQGTTGTRAGRAVDGAVALLGRRSAAGVPSDTAAAGASESGLSRADVNRIQRMLAPGNSAIVFVVARPYAGRMSSAMKQGHATQVLKAKLQPQR